MYHVAIHASTFKHRIVLTLCLSLGQKRRAPSPSDDERYKQRHIQERVASAFARGV